MVRNCNRWHESLAPGLVFDILTHHSSTRGATKQLLGRSHIDAFQFSASLGLEMNALCQSKKNGDHMWVLRCCGVAVQSRERQLMKIWQKSLRSWRIMRTWIVAFFFLQKNPRWRWRCGLQTFGRLPNELKGCNRTGPVPQQNQRCWGAGNMLDDLMLWYVMCFWWNTILSHTSLSYSDATRHW